MGTVFGIARPATPGVAADPVPRSFDGIIPISGLATAGDLPVTGVAADPVPLPFKGISRPAICGVVAAAPGPPPFQGHTVGVDRARRAEMFPRLAEDVETRRSLGRCSRRAPAIPAGPHRNTQREARAVLEKAVPSSARPIDAECAEDEQRQRYRH